MGAQEGKQIIILFYTSLLTVMKQGRGPIIIIVRFTTLPLVMRLGHWSNLVIGANVLI